MLCHWACCHASSARLSLWSAVLFSYDSRCSCYGSGSQKLLRSVSMFAVGNLLASWFRRTSRLSVCRLWKLGWCGRRVATLPYPGPLSVSWLLLTPHVLRTRTQWAAVPSFRFFSICVLEQVNFSFIPLCALGACGFSEIFPFPPSVTCSHSCIVLYLSSRTPLFMFASTLHFPPLIQPDLSPLYRVYFVPWILFWPAPGPFLWRIVFLGCTV